MGDPVEVQRQSSIICYGLLAGQWYNQNAIPPLFESMDDIPSLYFFQKDSGINHFWKDFFFLLTKMPLLKLQEMSFKFNMPQNVLVVRPLPWTHWGSSRWSPEALASGRWTPCLHSSPPLSLMTSGPYFFWYNIPRAPYHLLFMSTPLDLMIQVQMWQYLATNH